MVDLRTLLNRSLPQYFVLAETKLDDGFPYSQFLIDQYEIRTRRDRSKNGGGLIEYVRKGLSCKPLEDTISVNSKIILSNIETFLGDLSSFLSKCLSKYDNVIIMSDFNIDVKD